MHLSILEFFLKVARDDEIRGQRVLEVGSRSVTGSIRPFVELLRPAQYVGTDLEPGPNVDVVLPAERVLAHFGPGAFDVVVSTEMLEHARDWRAVVRNMTGVLRVGGVLYLTTRSYGTPYHPTPGDYWRFEVEDFKTIFADYDVEILQPDPTDPGVFLKARKTARTGAVDLAPVSLYSMMLGRRTRDVLEERHMPIARRLRLRTHLMFNGGKALAARFSKRVGR